MGSNFTNFYPLTVQKIYIYKNLFFPLRTKTQWTQKVKQVKGTFTEVTGENPQWPQKLKQVKGTSTEVSILYMYRHR